MAAFNNIIYQVFQQITTAIPRLICKPYHRGFINNEKGVCVLVKRSRHTHHPAAIGDGLVYFLMDGISWLSSITR
jgi:hypothetical protein